LAPNLHSLLYVQLDIVQNIRRGTEKTVQFRNFDIKRTLLCDVILLMYRDLFQCKNSKNLSHLLIINARCDLKVFSRLGLSWIEKLIGGATGRFFSSLGASATKKSLMPLKVRLS